LAFWTAATGIVEDDGLGATSDGGIDQLGLLVGVIVMARHQHLVAEFLGLSLRTLGFRLEEGVVMRRRDDGDQVGGLCR
jgi:hypothetical protein